MYFKKSTTLNFDGFIDAVKNTKSDIYLQLLCFIYENKPFTTENVEAYKYFKKKGDKSPSPKKNVGSPTQTKKENVLLSSPSRKSKLLPASTFLGLTPDNFNFQNLEKLGKSIQCVHVSLDKNKSAFEKSL